MATTFARPWWLADFESTFPFSIPTRFTDNAWRARENVRRAAANAARTAASLPALYPNEAMPMYPTEAQITIFCDPVADQSLPETGAGTIGNPYTRIASAFTAATGSSIVGIRTGRSCVLPAPGVAGTSNYTQITSAKSGMTVCAWIPSGAPTERTPTVVRRIGKVGTALGDWEEVNLNFSGSPGNTIITSTGWATHLLPGSNIWHLKTPATLNGGVGYVGYGDYDSILDVVTSANYRSHGRDSQHVHRSWMEDSGANVLIAQSPNGKALTKDMQFDFTDNAGFVCYSTQNPAQRWGGVYLSQRLSAFLSITSTGGDVNGATWLHALQADGMGTFIRFNVAAAGSIRDIYIEGLYTHLTGQPYFFEANINPSPLLGVSQGSIEMALGNNYINFGTSQKSWIEDCEFHYVRTLNTHIGPQHRGWHRRNRIHDVASDMSRLEGGGGPFYTGKLYVAADDGLQAGAYDQHDEYWNFYHLRLDCGTGKFGDSDGGIDLDVGTSHIWVHDGVVAQSSIGVQWTGGNANHKGWNIAMVDCLRPLDIGDALANGTMECDTFNYYLELADLSAWQASNGGSSGIDFDYALFIDLDRKLGYPGKGPLGDAEVRTYKSVRLRNGIVYDPYAQSASTVRNATLRDDAAAPALSGPWHSTGVAQGGGELSINGQIVPAGQAQQTTTYFPTIAGLHRVGTHGSLKVDIDDDNTGADTQTITLQVDDATAATAISNGFLLAGANATARTGAVACLPVSDGTIAHRLPGVPTDLRRVPTRTTGPSMGVYQYTEPSSVARNNLF